MTCIHKAEMTSNSIQDKLLYDAIDNTSHKGVSITPGELMKIRPLLLAIGETHTKVGKDLTSPGMVTLDDINSALQNASTRKVTMQDKQIYFDLVQFLLSVQNLNVSQKYMNTWFGMACRTYTSNAEIPKLLLQYGCDMNYELGDSGMSPLHEAVQRNCMTTVKFLVNSGAKVNVTSSELSRQGKVWSAVLPICCAKNKNMASFLLHAGSDITSCLLHPKDKDHLSEDAKESLKELFMGVQSLHHCSRMAIRKQISDCHFMDKVHSLPLPRKLQDYILFSDVQL